MELKHIKELMAAMGRSGTKRLTFKKDDFELTIERENGQFRYSEPFAEYSEDQLKQVQAPTRTDQALSRGGEMPAGRSVSPTISEPTGEKEETASVYITSPMVGTFYISPSPEDPPFVKVGDKVEKNTIVCIIEAMKVMNEIKAGVTGTIAEVLVETGQPVEFGTRLFRIT